VRTVEDLAGPDGTLRPLQRAFHEAHALECGFCTPSYAVAGVLCRCTGYDSIPDAMQRAVAAIPV
jgi:carbon-monoxide dehydrogenase small subunit